MVMAYTLIIESEGSKSIGRCYYETKFKVYSAYKISRAQFSDMFMAKILGYGQEFNVTSQCDGNELPTIDHGLSMVGTSQKMYVYNCYSRVDSSD